MAAVLTPQGPRMTTTSNSQGTGFPMTLSLEIADAASGDYDLQVDQKIEIIDVTVMKSGAGAGNSLQLKNGATAITDAIAATTDKAVTRAGTIDRAQSTIDANGTLRFSVVRAAGSGAMKVVVQCLIKGPFATQPTAP